MDAYSIVGYAVVFIFRNEASAKEHILSEIYKENTFQVTKKFNQLLQIFRNHSVVKLKQFLEGEVLKNPSSCISRLMTDQSISFNFKKYEI
jgi:hypothetical protein